MDFTSGWNSHFISTLDETLVNEFEISSGKGTYPMEIILSPELHVCFFSNRIYSIVKYRNRSIVFWFVIVFRKWGLHLLKSTAGNPKITCLKSQIIFHPPLPGCTLEKSPPGPKEIGRFWFGQNWAPQLVGRISGTSRTAATRCTAFTWMPGRCGRVGSTPSMNAGWPVAPENWGFMILMIRNT